MNSTLEEAFHIFRKFGSRDILDNQSLQVLLSTLQTKVLGSSQRQLLRLKIMHLARIHKRILD